MRSVLTVGALTAGVALAFPISALDFKVRTVVADVEASAAFVHLTADEEDLVLRSAKTAWQDETSAMQRMRVRLPLGDLPEEDAARTLEMAIPVGLSPIPPDPIPYSFPAYLPSAAAQPATRLGSGQEAQPASTFSRRELLELN